MIALSKSTTVRRNSDFWQPIIHRYFYNIQAKHTWNHKW